MPMDWGLEDLFTDLDTVVADLVPVYRPVMRGNLSAPQKSGEQVEELLGSPTKTDSLQQVEVPLPLDWGLDDSFADLDTVVVELVPAYRPVMGQNPSAPRESGEQAERPQGSPTEMDDIPQEEVSLPLDRGQDDLFVDLDAVVVALVPAYRPVMSENHSAPPSH